MNRPAATTIAVFLAIILVVGVVVAVVGLGTDGATALQVGDAELSQTSLNDELREFTSNPALVNAVGQDNVSVAPGSVNAQGTAFVATFWIQQQVAKRILERRDERVTGDDRASADDFFTGNFGGAFDSYPQSFQQRLKNRVAAVAAVVRISSDNTYRRLLRREAERAGVTVDPAYGLYRPRSVSVGRFPTPATPPGRSTPS